MDIFLVLVLLFAAWLGGHTLDYIFNKVRHPDLKEFARGTEDVRY